MSFGQSFKYYRKNIGYTQEEVAAKLMVTPQAVSKWEVGSGTPDITLLVPIAELFGITTDTLLSNTRRSREEICEEISRIDNLWSNEATNDENYAEKYKKLNELLKTCPDSMELLRSILQNSCDWLKYCSLEMSENKKNEIISSAEVFAKKLRDDLGDIHYSHCLMSEIYFYGGKTEKSEAEAAHFSTTGQFTKNRVKYMHLKCDDKWSDAQKYIEDSIKYTLDWLLWDIYNLATNYYQLGDRENMYNVYETMHNLLQALSYYNGNFFTYNFYSVIRLAQRAAQNRETEKCFGYLNEMTHSLQKLKAQKSSGQGDNCILFSDRHTEQSAKMSKALILDVLSWKSFDYIKKTEDFQEILKVIKGYDVEF